MKTFAGSLVVLISSTISSVAFAAEMKWTLTNPTGKEYRDEVVRLKVDLPQAARQGEYRVKVDGKEVPCQAGEADGRKWLFVVASLGADESIEYTVDRIGTERHHLSGRAKDLASAAVFLSLLLAGITWGIVIWERVTG